VQIVDFVPQIKDSAGRKREPSELKELRFFDEDCRDLVLAVLNSTLFRWLLTVGSDCRNLNKREIESIRFDVTEAGGDLVKSLCKLSQELMSDIKANSKVLSMRYERFGELRIQCTYPRYSKQIIDRIDVARSKSFGVFRFVLSHAVLDDSLR
jgi:hypothetical protein